jgi:hypothetical protein
MKATISTASVVMAVLALAGAAQAQGYATAGMLSGWDGYGYAYGHASTLEEGWLRGLASLAAAQGEGDYYNSLASINYQQAYTQYAKNCELATETYFKIKQTNKAAREAMQPERLTYEQYVSLAKKAAPARLTQQEYNRTVGRLNWPDVLTGDEFADERAELDLAFESRSPGDAGANSAFYSQVRQLSISLQAKLKDKVQELDTAQYVAAKRFLMSLSYESLQPLVSRSLAVAR